MLTYMGLKIIENDMLTETIEDWSRVRSHARARRRKHKHRQNIKIITVPSNQFYVANGYVICHPFKVHELRKALADNQSAIHKPVLTSKTTANMGIWNPMRPPTDIVIEEAPAPIINSMFRYNMFTRTNPLFRTDVI